MNKSVLIQDIQEVITRQGMFSIGEVQIESSPSLDTRGNLESYVEAFYLDHAIVVVYNRDYSIVDDYRLSYSDIPLSTLREIRKVCLEYEQLQQED
jgi:hypothetical protein